MDLLAIDGYYLDDAPDYGLIHESQLSFGAPTTSTPQFVFDEVNFVPALSWQDSNGNSNVILTFEPGDTLVASDIFIF